jgi:hypothetical protein
MTCTWLHDIRARHPTAASELLGPRIANGVTAVNVILAMSLGLIHPKLALVRGWKR